MGRNYHGLPVTLLSENPKAVGYYDQSPSRGEYDVKRSSFSITYKIIDSDPFYAGVLYQGGVAIAIIECLSGKEGLARALAEDDVETLRDVFQIRVTA